MDKSKFYLDLSKCTEEKKHIKTLTGIKNDSERIYLSFSPIQNVWGYFDSIGIKNKTEITYPEFIKLFECGEGEKEIDIEKMAKEALKFQHKNIQDRMIDFLLGFEEGFKKAMELNSNQ